MTAPSRTALAVLTAIVTLASPAASAARIQASQETPRPRILIDQPPRAVEYQLRRLTNDELAVLERRDDDVRYRLVYYALLTRKGLARPFRDEALVALMKMDRDTAPRVLLQALPMVPVDDTVTADLLLGLLLNQPLDVLDRDREALRRTVEDSSTLHALAGAYGALMVLDGTMPAAWQLASARDNHTVALLRAVTVLPAGTRGDALRAELAGALSTLLRSAPADDVRTAAFAALGATTRDRAIVELLAEEVLNGSAAASRTAAIRSLRRMPLAVLPADRLDAVARAIVALVSATPPARRLDADTVDALQLGEALATALGDERGRAVRRDLTALGVQVVRIETVPEELRFSVRWFVVEAGKRLQIVLANRDAMLHNLVVGRPGSLEQIGVSGAAMPVPTDPSAKPYVPDSPLVVAATRLLAEGETEGLTLVTPKIPGEYVYVCTFPGHWLRMYGVMLVVENLDTWEAKPTVPIDPMTKKPFATK